jgi:hypothetical protein
MSGNRDGEGPRNVISSTATYVADPTKDPCWGTVGKQKIVDEGPVPSPTEPNYRVSEGGKDASGLESAPGASTFHPPTTKVFPTRSAREESGWKNSHNGVPEPIA